MRSSTASKWWNPIGLAVALLALASCGGGGGGGGSAPPGSKLFVVDGGGHAIVSMINATPTVGTPISIDRVVEGSSTGLGTPVGTPSISSIPSIALDAAGDRLFAATQTSVVAFDGAGTIDGNARFSRSFTATVITDGITARSVNFYGLSLDTTNNRLYTVDPGGEVHVFNNASTRTGTTTPDRTVTPNAGTAIIGTFGVAVDSVKDKLYVGAFPNAATPFIMVFDGASTVNTNTAPNQSLAPDRTITLPGAGAFYLDQANDRLYVAQSNGQFLVFNTPSALTGAPSANRTITFPVSTTQNFIFVDTTRDKLYAVNNDPGGTQSALLIVDNASTASDTGGPTPMGIRIVLTSTNNNIRLSAVAVKP